MTLLTVLFVLVVIAFVLLLAYCAYLLWRVFHRRPAATWQHLIALIAALGLLIVALILPPDTPFVGTGTILFLLSVVISGYGLWMGVMLDRSGEDVRATNVKYTVKVTENTDEANRVTRHLEYTYAGRKNRIPISAATPLARGLIKGTPQVTVRYLPDHPAVHRIVSIEGKPPRKKAAKRQPAAPATANDPQTVLTQAITALADRADGAFVVFTHPASGRFVQFMNTGADSLLLDVPVKPLDESARLAVADYFAARGITAADTGSGMTAYQQDFPADEAGIAAAVEAAQALFVTVYGVNPEDGLDVATE
jgi:hypothetical protein